MKAGSKYRVDAVFANEEASAIISAIWGNKDSRLVQQSLSNEHYTPAKYIEAARTVLGGIDLDPASCEEANKVVKATAFFYKDDDGLTKEWWGRDGKPTSGGVKDMIEEQFKKLIVKAKATNDHRDKIENDAGLGNPRAVFNLSACRTDTEFAGVWEQVSLKRTNLASGLTLENWRPVRNCILHAFPGRVRVVVCIPTRCCVHARHHTVGSPLPNAATVDL
jgi:hypothetical protein